LPVGNIIIYFVMEVTQYFNWIFVWKQGICRCRS